LFAEPADERPAEVFASDTPIVVETPLVAYEPLAVIEVAAGKPGVNGLVIACVALPKGAVALNPEIPIIVGGPTRRFRVAVDEALTEALARERPELLDFCVPPA
jgi:hypothetical protein